MKHIIGLISWRDRVSLVTALTWTLILVPVALFASVSRWGLRTRIVGLWRHRIFELIYIRIFWLAVCKQRTEVKMFWRIAGVKIGNSCDKPMVFKNGGHGGFGRKFSQFYILFNSQLNTRHFCNERSFVGWYFRRQKQQKPEILRVLEFLTG